MTQIQHHVYGKSRVRVMKVIRDGKNHSVVDLHVDVSLEGDFARAYTDADNSNVVPTDTMKNTVYVFARRHALDTIEAFALDLGRHFVKTYETVTRARITVSRSPWSPLVSDGDQHAHVQPSVERATCQASVTDAEAVLHSGLSDLVILKTSKSAFSGFPRDEYTTLPESEDRLFGTSVTAQWRYFDPTVDYNAARTDVRTALVSAFAEHDSKSVQHTLHFMGEAALRECRAIDEIKLSMPNRHCLLVDLSPFGLDNPNEVFQPVDEPHGSIEAVLER